MPCASPYLPYRTYHTFPPNASDDLKTLMRHGFKQEMAQSILDTRGMTNWEVLQTDCTALFFKKYWDRMNARMMSQRRRQLMPSEGLVMAVSESSSASGASAALGSNAKDKRCAIL
ncbi:hypothetical protein TWF694_000071 [Orbilia ellipsospora]|uniref:Uncharacterized protein n=1 Tax=Orbilia ellipsospora TaxID=2528407 RepID=A0AAV9XU79_9PEZI